MLRPDSVCYVVPDPLEYVMQYQIFQVFHLVALFLLVGIAFAAFAAPYPERRRRTVMCSGICSLLVFVSGFGLLGILELGFPGWIIVKLFCWVVIATLVGMVFRKPDQVKLWFGLTIVLILMAVGMVSFRPF